MTPPPLRSVPESLIRESRRDPSSSSEEDSSGTEYPLAPPVISLEATESTSSSSSSSSSEVIIRRSSDAGTRRVTAPSRRTSGPNTARTTQRPVATTRQPRRVTRTIERPGRAARSVVAVGPRITPSGDTNTASDLTERRARHILRVSSQTARRTANPPPRRRRFIRCVTCAIEVTARQYDHHTRSRPHLRHVAFEANREAWFCRFCRQQFYSEQAFTQHAYGNKHRTRVRHSREPLS